MKIADFCKTAAGGTPLKSNKAFYDNGNIPWLLSGEVGKKNITETKNFITQAGLDGSSAKMFPVNTVLIAMYGATAGEVGILRCEASTNQAVCGIYPNDKVLPEYLYYFFLDHKDLLVAQAVGNAQPNISQQKIKNTEIDLPTIAEQKRIVAILDEVFADVEQARAKTEQNLKNARELFESYLQQVFSQLGGECALRFMSDKSMLTMVDGDRGKNYPQKSDFYTSGYCLFLSTKNVRPNGFLFDETVFIDEHRDNLLGKGKLAMNDVILTTRGTIGNLALLDETVDYENIRINSGMLILRPNTQVLLPSYLFEIMRSGIVKRQIEEKVSGAAQPQLPIKTLNTFSFPVPASLELQREVVNKIKVLEASINGLAEIYEEKLNSLTELKQSTLKKAFSGELTQGASKEEVA